MRTVDSGRCIAQNETKMNFPLDEGAKKFAIKFNLKKTWLSQWILVIVIIIEIEKP